jgi:hypothetical protein
MKLRTHFPVMLGEYWVYVLGAVVFAIMTQSGYSAGGGRADGEAVGCGNIGPCGTLFPTYNYSIHDRRLTPFKTLSPFE